MTTTLDHPGEPVPATTAPATPVELADAYLRAARTGEHERGVTAADGLAGLDDAALSVGLPDDAARLAFWIDIYNGAAMRQPGMRLDSWRARLHFLHGEAVRVAGEPLSLALIENGILRRGRWRFGGGYIRSLRRTAFERRHQVERLDARLHFALNCAAASCPPIAAYTPERIEEQLDLATRSYLSATVTMTDDEAYVPKLLLWYRGDFRAWGGARPFLAAHGADIGARKLRWADYDWTPMEGRWADDDD